MEYHLFHLQHYQNKAKQLRSVWPVLLVVETRRRCLVFPPRAILPYSEDIFFYLLNIFWLYSNDWILTGGAPTPSEGERSKSITDAKDLETNIGNALLKAAADEKDITEVFENKTGDSNLV